MVWSAAVLIMSAGVGSGGESWEQFRGPKGDGVVRGSHPPVEWSEDENVTWKIAIHDRGWSSPVVADGQIWLTTATEDGTKLYGICIDAESGRVHYDNLLFQIADPQFAHKFNSYASPTPVIEGDFVYLTFGSPGTACINRSTFETIWTREDLECDHFRGAGSSPVIFRDLLIMHYDGADLQYVIALDKKTGETVWQTNRSVDFMDLDVDGKPKADGDFRKAYSTPYLFSEPGSGSWVMASLGSKAAYGYDPATGRELWRYADRSAHSGTGTPLVAEGQIFYVTGFSRGTLYSLPVGARGVLESGDVLWESKRNVPNKPSPVYFNGHIYMIDDGGIASCLRASDGEEMWRERVGGNYSASPLVIDGQVYFFSEEGVATVIQASEEFKVVASSKLDDGFMATPAVAGDALFLRTKTHLYRVEE